jgi:predicted nucleic acid-binding protein
MTVKSIDCPVTPAAQERARQFIQVDFKAFDALHVATAEAANVDVFLTTDDKFLKYAERISIHIPVMNPVNWLMEVLKHE